MMRKRPTPNPCPKCFGKAHIAECHNSKRNVTRFAVVCDDLDCEMSTVPLWMACFKTEEDAVADWNGDRI